MGYSPYQTESTNPSRPPEQKEAFNVRFPLAHENDYRLSAVIQREGQRARLELIFSRAAHRYALACALALGSPYDFFDEKVDNMDLCTIRFLHYAPCDFESMSVSTADKPIRVGEYTDFDAFTFLLLGANGAEGFQIKPVEGSIVEGKGTVGEIVGGWTQRFVLRVLLSTQAC